MIKTNPENFLYSITVANKPVKLEFTSLFMLVIIMNFWFVFQITSGSESDLRLECDKDTLLRGSEGIEIDAKQVKINTDRAIHLVSVGSSVDFLANMAQRP